jgi:twitching motility two-component system response regulator PilG
LMRVAPDHGSARVALRNALGAHAHAHAQAGRNEEACERWREAIAVGGGDVEAWLGLSEATADQDEAARAVEMAYQLDPADARALAAMERLQGPQFDPATVAAPDDAFARFGPLDDELTPFELTNESQEPIDSLLDAFATAAEPPQTAALESEAAASAGVEVTPPAPIEIAMVPPEVLEVPEALAGSASPAVLEVPDVPPALPAEPASTPGPIMIVDDSPTIRKILGLTLERAGYTVVAECDGQSALDRLQEVVPQLILLDISMPKLDGYEVCKRIKLDPRIADVPVIMLSGKGAFFDKVKGHMAGATEYLTKPFETPAVLAVVTGYCRPAAEQHHG